MNLRHGWLFILAIAVLLVAACGPMPITPTPQEGAAQDAATAVPTENTATAAQEETPAEEPATVAELPVNADDWRVLGSPDAAVTIVEYSDFQ